MRCAHARLLSFLPPCTVVHGHHTWVYLYSSPCLCVVCAGCVANMTRWFPDYKGLAAGFTVMGFGFGAFVWQMVGNSLMNDSGYAAYQVFGIFAAIFIIAMVVSLPFIRAPPPGFNPPPAPPISQQGCGMKILSFLFPTSKPTPPDKPYTFLEAIMQQEYVLICIAMFGTFLPGVVFMSSAADMTKYVFHKDPSYANLIVRIFRRVSFVARHVPCRKAWLRSVRGGTPVASCSRT